MRHALSLAILFCAATSCLQPVIERQCEKDADCGSGWICIAQNCVPPGSSSNDGGVGGGTSAAGGGTSVGGGGTSVGGGSAGGGAATGGGPVGGGGGTSLCNQTNCPDGCCAGGACILASVQTNGLCGLKAAACQACASGSACSDGVCTGGACNAMNCPDGCCSGNGCVNQNNQSSLQCGNSGAACSSCTMGTECTGGTCAPLPCNIMTCPDGCCDGTTCIPLPSQTTAECGQAGNACEQCDPTSSCNLGTCAAGGCGAQSCLGCCFNGSCLGGLDEFACGVGGDACTVCPPTSTCLDGFCAGCGAVTCTGCCQNGFCQSGNDNTACGMQGNVCEVCPVTESCEMQRCGGVMKQAFVGDPCSADSDCATIAPGAICKHFTSTGSGVYQNGYCTLLCTGANTCPGGSECETIPSHGETDSLCLKTCDATAAGCRNPGYACYMFGTTVDACWIFPEPPLSDGGIVTVDAGSFGEAVGHPCTQTSQCEPETNLCIPELLGMFDTGYVGGYCSEMCTNSPCPVGSVCVADSLGGMASTNTCKSLCSNPGMGQGSCRTGYICQTSASGLSWCGPRCNNQTLPCLGNGTCNAMTGYCN